DDRSLLVWGETPQEGSAAPEEGEDESAETSATEKLPPARQNVLFVAPAKPLPPGRDWRLVLDAGLPAADGNATLPARRDELIGVVKPFGVSNLTAESNRVAGRRLVIEFSKSLADDVTAETIGRWIKVEPAPADLKVSVDETFVTLKGDFALGTRYRVSVAPGVPAAEPTETTAPFRKELAFSPIAPRLFFQDFAGHQFLRGTRELRLLSVNVPRVRVSAKLFKGDEIPAALKAYDAYMEMPTEGVDEMYSRVNTEALGGTVVWEKEIAAEAAVDTQNTIALSWNELVGENRSGAVLVTAESVEPVPPNSKRVGTQTLMQLTDLGAVWKRDREGTWLHVFSLASGKGVAGVRLRLLSGEGVELAEAVADERGDARLPQNDEMRWVFAETGDDAHLIALASGENDVPLYRLGVSEEIQDDEGSNSIFMFTERGVYKPGDKVHLKGYAQDLRAEQPRIPAGKPVTVTVTDAKERQIFSEHVTLSEFGSFDREITVPEGTLGRYRINATGEKGERLGGSCFFEVQEYRPNAFEILIPPPPGGTGGVQLALPITAKYFMGKPLSRAKLTWSLVARDENFRPEGLGDFAFGNAIYDFRLNRALDRLSQFNAQGDLAIGDNGIAELTTQLPINPKAPQPRAAKLLTEVTDLNQQTVSESRAWVQHSSDFYFGLRRFESVLKEGQPLPIELIAVQPAGTPLAEPVRATLRLTRINWQTNRLATAGDTTEFESKAQLHVEWERELTTVAGVGDDRKPARALLDQAVAGKPGEYLLEAIGKDAHGHDVLTSLVFEVSGDAEMAWNYRNPYAIDLVADKESYEPGQTATIMVKTPIAGDALVTVERDRVLRSFIVPLTGNAPSVQVPLTQTDGPNVYVSVMLLRGANDSPRKVKTPEYRIGYCNLKVARPEDRLTVVVKPGNRTALPGERVQLEAEVRDLSGAAAADAEVTLYAVDEGVLSLTRYETPDALAFFNQPRGLGVSTSLTLPTLLREDAAESDFANKGYLVGDGK
ncbi:MAG: MG2 domain-containing protein, partial [Verrucomicrobiota bacterium]|nr:MG2 domain-containing protein [Verrucomicrobiota bacterium]